jgi:hypothetical protein
MRLDELRAAATLRAATAAFLACAAAPATAGGGVHHVPADFPTIQAAADAAAPGDTVVVADGVYKGAGNRDVDMRGKALVIRSANGPDHCVIDCEGSYDNPHRAFQFSSGESRAARVEGFTIRGGATPPGAIADTFNGGAILVVDSSPTIAGCTFVENTCGCWGGAVYARGGSPLIESCLFLENTADDDGGAFFCWSGASPTIVSSAFVGNRATVQGGAIANFGGGVQPFELLNVTIAGNGSLVGSAIASWGPTTIESSIIWANTGSSAQITGSGDLSVTYSNVQGGLPGLGNLNVDPLFEKDGYHLASDSPCANAGSPGAPPSPFDVDGHARLIGARVDIGADELLALHARTR